MALIVQNTAALVANAERVMRVAERIVETYNGNQVWWYYRHKAIPLMSD